MERFFLNHEPPSLAKPRAIALRKPLRFSFVPRSEPPPRMSSWIGDMVGISGVVAFYVFLDLCSKIREKSTFSTHPIHAPALIRGSFFVSSLVFGECPLRWETRLRDGCFPNSFFVSLMPLELVDVSFAIFLRAVGLKNAYITVSVRLMSVCREPFFVSFSKFAGAIFPNEWLPAPRLRVPQLNGLLYKDFKWFPGLSNLFFPSREDRDAFDYIVGRGVRVSRGERTGTAFCLGIRALPVRCELSGSRRARQSDALCLSFIRWFSFSVDLAVLIRREVYRCESRVSADDGMLFFPHGKRVLLDPVPACGEGGAVVEIALAMLSG